MQRYLARLEHYARLAPYNWFNFTRSGLNKEELPTKHTDRHENFRWIDSTEFSCVL